VTGYNRTPAAAYISALMGPSNPFPVSLAEFDMELLAEWHDWCVLKGLKYDRVHDQSESLDDVLQTICVAGRATYRHDGVQWGVVVDWPQEIVIDHINPRNSDEFTWSRNYFDAPDGFRIPFQDETNNYGAAERIVPWPGHVGEVVNTEEIQMPGKTDPDEIWIEARRRMYELIHRPDNFSAMQSGRARVVTRGDLVMGSVDVLQRTQAAGRVIEVLGNLVVLDETIEVGDEYAARFKVYANDEDQIGTSTVRPIAASSEPINAFRLTGSGPVPEVGAIVHVGPIASESFSLRVRGIEGAQNHEARLLMVEAAPQIDVLTDAEVPPTWDGRIGTQIALSLLTPMTPIIAGVRTASAADGTPAALEILLKPGTGSTVTLTRYEVRHRLGTSGAWTTVYVPIAAGGLVIDDYAVDQTVTFVVRADASGKLSPSSPVLSVVIGADDPDSPLGLDDEGVQVLPGLGPATVSIAVPSADAPDQVQIYRAPSGTPVSRTTHAVQSPIVVTPGSTMAIVDGDSTRATILSNGDFASATGWTAGNGWTIASGAASHADTGAGTLQKAITTSNGGAYRIAANITGRTDGGIVPKLLGGVAVSGLTTSTNGILLSRLVATSSTTSIGFTAEALFDGTMDDVIVFKETASCVDAGAWDYWIEPQNNLGFAGPMSGPFTVTIL
jgi:hypothetical protein